jgi:hypothetical protein
VTSALRPTQLIWATRGRSWGFRFLLDAGFEDPLTEYERAFAGVSDAPTAYAITGDRVALRFPDPDGRRDAAGRIIPHEFVVFGEFAKEIHSVDAGVRQVWPLVQDAFARTWMLAAAPQAADLRFTV